MIQHSLIEGIIKQGVHKEPTFEADSEYLAWSDLKMNLTIKVTVNLRQLDQGPKSE